MTRDGQIQDGQVSYPGFLRPWWKEVDTIVAGHFAEWTWSQYKICARTLLDGSENDFKDIVRRYRNRHRSECAHARRKALRLRRSVEDVRNAQRDWRAGMRRLKALAARDPLFKRQVFAIAEALIQRRTLKDAELRSIMEKKYAEEIQVCA
jgi:hypothetical protein